MILESLTVGLMLYTYHPANNEPIPELQLNNNTPGFYVQSGHLIGAVFRNSFGRTSVMGGFVYRAGPFDLTLGAATGYQYKHVPIACSEYIFTSHGMTPPANPENYSCTGKTGTTNAVLRPMFGVGYSFPEMMGVRPRITFLGKALNFSIEHTFK